MTVDQFNLLIRLLKEIRDSLSDIAAELTPEPKEGQNVRREEEATRPAALDGDV